MSGIRYMLIWTLEQPTEGDGILYDTAQQAKHEAKAIGHSVDEVARVEWGRTCRTCLYRLRNVVVRGYHCNNLDGLAGVVKPSDYCSRWEEK